MEKNNFIKELIRQAQENIWKNELAIAYKEKYPDVSDLSIKATQEHIKRDKDYIEFLLCELSE